MKKNMKTVIGIIGGIIIVLVLFHLAANWLVPLIIKMHSGAAG